MQEDNEAVLLDWYQDFLTYFERNYVFFSVVNIKCLLLL